jgi:hypothetical protein
MKKRFTEMMQFHMGEATPKNVPTHAIKVHCQVPFVEKLVAETNVATADTTNLAENPKSAKASWATMRR